MITGSSFRALQGQRLCGYVFIYFTLLVLFSLFQGVLLVRLLRFFSIRRLFGARQLTAKVSLVHVSLTTGAYTVPLEPRVVLANGVHDAAEADDADHVKFKLDELKEQLQTTIE